MADALPMLKVEGIRKSFGGTEVLRGIDLAVPKSTTTVLLGASGSGKTTLLRCLNHLETPDAGVVWLDGETVGGSYVGPRGAWVPAAEAALNRQRAQMGFVFQRFNLFPHLSALDNVAIGPRRVLGLDAEAARRRAQQALERVHLAAHAAKRPVMLSGGQQQRVAIARSLAMEPKVILFDEPTSALDPHLVNEVLEVMRDLARQGMTMVVVTHEMSFAANVAHQVVFMAGGQVCEAAPPASFFATPQHDETRQFLKFMRHDPRLVQAG